MPRATCRCGQVLKVPDDGTDRLICTNCGAKIRVRRDKPRVSAHPVDDGFVRFECPCGRRLKVPVSGSPTHGKCPDCGRVVPVPMINGMAQGAPKAGLHLNDPERQTDELTPDQLGQLQGWTQAHLTRGTAGGGGGSSGKATEAGMRVCPKCGRPIHLGADTCRGCGTVVPKK